MKKNSKLFIIDAIVPEGNTPHFSKDLEAFLMSWGGQERDQQEFNRLVEKSGLKVSTIHETPSLLSIIEVTKP